MMPPSVAASCVSSQPRPKVSVRMITSAAMIGAMTRR